MEERRSKGLKCEAAVTAAVRQLQAHSTPTASELKLWPGSSTPHRPLLPLQPHFSPHPPLSELNSSVRRARLRVSKSACLSSAAACSASSSWPCSSSSLPSMASSPSAA